MPENEIRLSPRFRNVWQYISAVLFAQLDHLPGEVRPLDVCNCILWMVLYLQSLLGPELCVPLTFVDQQRL